MNILLVYPAMPPSFWSFSYALRLIGKKAAMPPLSLLTVAGLIPRGEHDIRLVDLNVRDLSDADLAWSDAVFISAMIVQRDSFHEVARRARQAGKITVAGGPYPTSYVGSDELRDVDYLVLDEVEETLHGFLNDLDRGTAACVYRASRKPPITLSPVPRYDLIDLDDYTSMLVQFSRGCPKNCEFCDITKLYGRVPRTKAPGQVLTELGQLYNLGWQGHVFFVDDNFVGNWRAALELMPFLIEWQAERGFPFSFTTEASIDIVRHPALLEAMAAARFEEVFVGIETPSIEALRTMKKHQNIARGDPQFLERAVRALQGYGFEVMAGFILGVDDEPENPFDPMIEFIQEAGIPMATVSLQAVLPGTDLEKRLGREGRLRGDTTGTNFELVLNYVPQKDPALLIEGYERVLDTIYDARLEMYFGRCLTLMTRLRRRHWPKSRWAPSWIRALPTLLWTVPREIPSEIAVSALKFLVRVLRRHPKFLPEALVYIAKGHHLRQMTEQLLISEAFEVCVERELRAIVAELARCAALQVRDMEEHVRAYLEEHLALLRCEYAKVHADFKYRTARSVQRFFVTIKTELRCFGIVHGVELEKF